MLSVSPMDSVACPPPTKMRPVCEFGGISVYAVRLSEEPEFVHQLAQLRAMAFGSGETWNYGLDPQDWRAIQLAAFDASGLVGALRLCLGDEVLAQSGLQGFYMDTGWEFGPQAEPFFATAMEYGRFWAVRGHPRTPGIMNALLASLGSFAEAHPRYQCVLGTVALLDHSPEACRLIAAYLRRYHMSEVRRLRPRRPVEAEAHPPPAAEASRPKAFRALVHQLREVDPDHPLPALLHLYLRQGAEMIGDVSMDGTGRKMLIPLHSSMTTFLGFVGRLRSRAGSIPGLEPINPT
jgi:hypothetical protein